MRRGSLSRAAEGGAVTRGAPPRVAFGRRWLFVGALLVAEYLLLSLRVHPVTAILRGGEWEVIGQVGFIPMVGVAVATTLWMMRAEGGSARGPSAETPRVRWSLFVLHGVLLGLFCLVSARVFAQDRPPPRFPIAWVALWGALGASTALALTAAFFDLRGVVSQISGPALAAGTVVGVAAWAAAEWSHALWSPLAHATLSIVTAELRPLFPDIATDASEGLVTVHGFSAEIGAPCSGVEGIGLITLMLAGFLFASRRLLRFPRALLLLPLGVAVVWMGNTIRLAALLTLGACTNPQVAFRAFHSKAGWVLFCAIALGLAWLGRRSRFFSAEDAPPRDALDENPTAAYVLPLLATLAAAMVTGMFAPGLDRLYGVRVVVGLAVLYAYRPFYRAMSRDWAFGSLVVGAVVGVAWLASARWTVSTAPAVVASPGLAWVVVRLLGSIVVIPICEELAFRGYLLRWVVSRDFTRVMPNASGPVAIAVSSLAFGLIHDRWIAGALAGVVYALVVRRTDRIMDGVVAHAMSNAVIAGHVLVTHDWPSWA